jgi:hypothetical protein
MKSRTHNLIIALMTLILLGSLGYYFAISNGYLLSSTQARLDTPDLDEKFGASGLYGHGLGFLAALFMLLLILYIIRKRWNRLRGWGKLSQWLKYHMWFGVAAPLLATFHSSFKFEGLIGVMYWAMIAVMLSGIVGRYLYGHIPRRRDGHELSSEQMNTEKAAKLRDLQFEFGIASQDIGKINAITPAPTGRGILRSLGQLIYFDIRKRFEVKRVLASLEDKYNLAHSDLHFLKTTIENQLTLAQRMLVLDSVSRVFHWWHVIHKPFAYAIFVVLTLHIVLTLSFGFTWIF